MHEKFVFIDDQIVWTGSLNVLSFSGNTTEIMSRFYTPNNGTENIFSTYAKMLKIPYLLSISQDKEQLQCPICHKDLILKTSTTGWYWNCENDDFKLDDSQSYPKDGMISCKKCGAPLRYQRKKQPRWECTQDPRHYQQINRADLLLPGMRSLISPESEFSELEKYFREKENK